MKINAVVQLTQEHESENVSYTDPKKYWYDNNTGTVYDYELQYAIGHVSIVDNLPKKLDNNTYIIDKLIPIPMITDNN